MPAPPADTIGDYIAALMASPRYGRQVAHHRILPGRDAAHAPNHRPWPRAIRDLLALRGIDELYSHQSYATDLIRAGHHVVVATPTASGKTFVYNLPVLERFLTDPEARSIYLFPLKALAQDQLATFTSLTEHWPKDARPRGAIYDGDTTAHFRRKIRQNPPTVLMTNPEMLHLSVLPHHEQWTSLLASLAFIVVDEVHTYRGVLGAHMAQVFRRLVRLCNRYGAHPTFIFCSATVGNPGELATLLAGPGVGAGWQMPHWATADAAFASTQPPHAALTSRPADACPSAMAPCAAVAAQPTPAAEGCTAADAGGARGAGGHAPCRGARGAEPPASPCTPPDNSPATPFTQPRSAPFSPSPTTNSAPTAFSTPAPLAHQPATPQLPVSVITTSGAPQGARHMVFMDPEESPSTMAIQLLRSALARGLRTIIYCQSRRMTELISLWATEKSGQWKNRISAYRAGFLPEERREIEGRMSSGELLAVITTSALELGIDIGSLDLCILVGYPGTVMATLQRGGRVGRAQQESAVVLIAGEDALDQYFIRHPAAFFEREAERAVLNPENDVILRKHLECAAAELSLAVSDPWLTSPGVARAAAQLEHEGLLLRTADGTTLLAARKRPHRHVDLRGCGAAFTIEDAEGNAIGSVDGHRAWRETHPGAIYLHRGRSYVITELDPPTATVRARQERVNWFTRVRGNKDTVILEELAHREAWGTRIHLGRLRVTETITGYERRTSGGQLLNIVPLNLPPLTFETEGLWFEIPDAPRIATENELLHFMGAIHALEHAAIGILPLLVMTDRNDLGGISTPMHAQVGRPAVFIYDGMPGGAGLARQAYANAHELFARTRDAVADCPCETGCPSCVHSPKCGSGNRPIDKAGALFLLDRMREGTPEPYVPPSITPDISPDISSDMAQDISPDMPWGVRPDVPPVIAPEMPPDISPKSAHDAPKPDPTPQQGAPKPVWVYGTDSSSQQQPHTPETTMPNRTDGNTLFSVSNASPQASPSDAAHPATPGEPGLHYMVLDVETRRSAAEVGGWHKADKMGVSIAVLYDSATDAYTAYPQDDMPAMLTHLRKADLVIGFNIQRFDYAVLSPFAAYDLHTLPTLDMLTEVKNRLAYRVSLDNLASATLNVPKSADGLQALQWWKEGRLDLITQYCQKDVEITRALYLYGKHNRYLLFTNKAGQAVRVPVGW